MIEFLQQQISGELSVERKVHRLRELLQLLCLKAIHDKGYFSELAFVGGTALRILYGVRRFSEDLDFSVIDKKRYDFSDIVSSLRREFQLYGLTLETKPKVARTVQSSMLQFAGLLKIMGLSELEGQKLSIKLEVDSNPPQGWQIENTLISNIYVLNIVHFDLSSLYATKLHSCFFRRYAKGRDFYDLVWYLGKRLQPNYELLNNAIKQTEGEDLKLSKNNIKTFLLEKLAKIDFDAVRKDVERFLEDKNELKLLNLSVISKGVIDVFG